MEKLNAKSTSVFCILMGRLKDGFLKIHNKPHLPLALEEIGVTILPELRTAELYRLSVYYFDNNIMMQRPEMRFAVIDERNGASDYSKVTVIPYMLCLPEEEICEYSIDLEKQGSQELLAALQQEHTEFANTWLENIQIQGYLERDPVEPE